MFMEKFHKRIVPTILSLLLLFVVSGCTETEGTLGGAAVGTAGGAGIGYAVGGQGGAALGGVIGWFGRRCIWKSCCFSGKSKK